MGHTRRKKKKKAKRKLERTDEPPPQVGAPDDSSALVVDATARPKKKKRRKKNSNNTTNIDANPPEREPTCARPEPVGPPSTTTTSSSQRSLASELKRKRGTAATTPLPPEWPPADISSSRSSPHHREAPKKTKKNILIPSDGNDFSDCLQRSYRGLSWEEPSELPPTLHSNFDAAFDELNDAGLFLYDVVQPGRQRLSRTKVRRTLVGEPGSTYKYLGLRLFSHPWCDVDENGDRLSALDDESKADGGGVGVGGGSRDHNTRTDQRRGSTLRKLGYTRDCARGLLRIGHVNRTLVGRTRSALQNDIAPRVKPTGLVGSAQYNLTLINRMDPATTPSSVKREFKSSENSLVGQTTSVSWHKDSGLQDFSSIAVYHALRDGESSGDVDDNGARGSVRTKKRHRDLAGRRRGDDVVETSTDEAPWRIAVRVASAQSATPALSIPLPSGALYYLLDDFNHQHEHAALAGSNQLRYSSTHRVAREGRGTWGFIRDLCRDLLSKKTSLLLEDDTSSSSYGSTHNVALRRKQLVKEVRAQQQLITELEFEWIRQWYVQGKSHADLHPYWHKPMKRLLEAYRELERRSVVVVTLLRQAADGSSCVASRSDAQAAQQRTCARTRVVGTDLYDVMIESIEERERLRDQWHGRYRDPIFSSLPAEATPMSCSVLDRGAGGGTSFTVEDLSLGQMPEDLAALGSDLRKWRASFVENKNGDSSSPEKEDGGVLHSYEDEKKGRNETKKKKNRGKGALTKKEQRRVASNWERMKSSMIKKKRL